MATATIQKLVRDRELAVTSLTSDFSSGAGSSGISVWPTTTIIELVRISTDASTMSTGDADLYVPFAQGDKIGFIVGWGSTQATAASTGVNLVIKAGSGSRASWRRDLGDYTLTLQDGATGPLLKRWMLGPFEDSRFGITNTGSTTTFGVAVGQKYAHLQLRVGTNSSVSATGTATSGAALSLSVYPFSWPEVVYAT